MKGRIRHPDHKTIRLPVWHRVVPNTEDRAAASRKWCSWTERNRPMKNRRIKTRRSWGGLETRCQAALDQAW